MWMYFYCVYGVGVQWGVVWQAEIIGKQEWTMELSTSFLCLYIG